MVNSVLSVLECSPQESVYIGDSEVDLVTAANAAMACICVDWGFRDRADLLAQGANLIVSTPEELTVILTKSIER